MKQPRSLFGRTLMTQRRRFGSAAAAALLVAPVLLAAEAPRTVERARLAEAYGQVPLAFEANAGQADPRVAFLARGAGYGLFLTPGEAVLSLRPSKPGAEPAVLRLKLRGAQPSPRIAGLDPQAGQSHYFVGDDPSRWRSHVPHFGAVRYDDVYPGIDLVFYGRQRQLEFDFVVQPGADPRQIGLDFEGSDGIALDAEGDLIVQVGEGALRQHKPVVYQELDGERQPVAGAYVVEGPRRAAFRLGDYDPARPLVIDPVLVYSTYLGGGEYDEGHAIAVDGAGNAYVVGTTASTDFPTASPAQVALAGGEDVFVSKLNPSGSVLLYSTYLGGSNSDYGHGIAVDASGNAYVMGDTFSANFPTANPLQAAFAGGQDLFVAKLNASGSALLYSTYLGGSSSDYGNGIAVDGSGNAFATGSTISTNFPTANPFQGTHASAGGSDAFVAKLNALGSALVYSTYLGGGSSDFAQRIAVDATGSAYVVGETFSTDFPLANAIQGANAGNQDAFVTKLNAAGSALVYSTYLGGGGGEFGSSIAVDGSGNAYVAGETGSADFPTANPLQGAKSGSSDAFVARLNGSGSAFVYSTYLGGSGYDRVDGIAVDGSGSAYVVGVTTSTNLPMVSPVQAAFAGGYDAFVAKLNSPGSRLLYSTYLGGAGIEFGSGIAVDGVGNAYVTGDTDSTNFPTANQIQDAYAGGAQDSFVAKLASMAKGDFDSDGHPDLVFRSNANAAHNKVWIMNGVARVSDAPISPDASSADWRIRGVDDFDGDDRNDLVFRNQTTGNVEFWLMNGTSRVGAAVPLTGAAALPAEWDLAATADFDRDGRPDIVWRSTTTQKIVIWTMNGTVKVGALVPTPDQAVDGNWGVVAALDYSADGNPDLLWFNSTSGKVVTWYMNSSAVRTSGQFTTPPNAGDANWKVVASSDFSRNSLPGTPPVGSPDIVWRNATSGNQVVWHMDFNSARVHGEFTSPAANSSPLDWTVVGPR